MPFPVPSPGTPVALLFQRVSQKTNRLSMLMVSHSSRLRRTKRFKADRSRTVSLGSDPKAVRILLLQKVFTCLCKARKEVITLHLLGTCFRVPGLDYVMFEYAGNTMPNQSKFDNVCKWCATLKHPVERMLCPGWFRPVSFFLCPSSVLSWTA